MDKPDANFLADRDYEKSHNPAKIPCGSLLATIISKSIPVILTNQFKGAKPQFCRKDNAGKVVGLA